jgi:phospholipid transport system substrate-binding protein
MRGNRWVLMALVGLACFLPAHDAWAADPTDELRSRVNLVLELLRDPVLAVPEAAGNRRLAIRQAVDGVLDFGAMAQRALGRHWEARTPAERQEFVGLFGDLLESLYIGEIERHGDDPITYLNESLAGNQATVETKVNGKSNVRLDYRMHLQDGRWLVYDVEIGGMSIVDNFRSQLARVLRDSSFADMIQQLRDTTAGQAAPGSRRR